MATWDTILSHYSFDSKHYSEFTDPANLSKPFVDVVLEYHLPAFRPNSNRFLHQDYSNVLSPIITTTNTLYNFPISVEMTYLDVLSTSRQCILFSKYHNFLSLYNHSDFIKMHMHNAWLLKKTNLTIDLPYDYFTKAKHLFVFCGTLTLNQVWDNRDVNTFDYHLFLFAASYLMIRDSFMLQMLKGSSPVSFRLNNTILPTRYALLNLELDFPHFLAWFELHFKFFNHDFVCTIKHLPNHVFKRRFLNFERHNEWYQEHFFNDFLGHAHCTTSCDICIEHGRVHFYCVNYELSHFKANYFDEEAVDSKFCPFTYEQDNQLFQTFTTAVLYHKCTTSCTLPFIKKQHFNSFS